MIIDFWFSKALFDLFHHIFFIVTIIGLIRLSKARVRTVSGGWICHDDDVIHLQWWNGTNASTRMYTYTYCPVRVTLQDPSRPFKTLQSANLTDWNFCEHFASRFSFLTSLIFNSCYHPGTYFQFLGDDRFYHTGLADFVLGLRGNGKSVPHRYDLLTWDSRSQYTQIT